ncbi:MAG: 3-octaprenyl-4-hydroxybenzoate carboxy-lyase, partial [Saprospiraceae bacterium]|nr:3-octaprenyl-4-hydroxybenzoate carboxy-lyase [Saprospiraceae bacterium]
MKKIVLGIAGSSGAIYAKVMLDRLVRLQSQLDEVGIIMSENAQINWDLEI